jgi:3-oxoacyl-[acyl-carrier protein] reductase
VKVLSLGLGNKIAVITGAGGEIGRTIALTLATYGVKVAVNDVNEKNTRKVVEEVLDLGGEAFPVIADVSKIKEVESMTNLIVKRFGRLDILVNNAATIHYPVGFHKISDDLWDKILDVNLKGVFNCTKAISKVMVQQRYGKIINITSIAGLFGIRGEAAYSASKSGITGFTKAIAKELAKYGININCVAPGLIDTDFLRKNIDKKVLEEVVNKTPLKRIGQPEDVANCVLFLASDLSNFITGQTIVVDGGLSLNPLL